MDNLYANSYVNNSNTVSDIWWIIGPILRGGGAFL